MIVKNDTNLKVMCTKYFSGMKTYSLTLVNDFPVFVSRVGIGVLLYFQWWVTILWICSKMLLLTDSSSQPPNWWYRGWCWVWSNWIWRKYLVIHSILSYHFSFKSTIFLTFSETSTILSVSNVWLLHFERKIPNYNAVHSV